MLRRLIVLGLFAVVVAGCGHSARRAQQQPVTVTTIMTAPPTTTSATTAPSEVVARVYFIRDGKLAPVGRVVSPPAVASQALGELAAGPSASESGDGYQSNVHSKYQVTINNGIATVDGTDLTHAGLAQIVYTLTQFPSVHGVRTARVIGDAKPLTRADFEDVTPQILVESPLPNTRVVSPLRITGTADTYEATFLVELHDANGRLLARKVVTATSGSGQRGTFDTTVSFSGIPAVLAAWEPSAENGKPLHEVRIPLR